MAERSSDDLARQIAEVMEDKKATDLDVLAVGEVVSYTDYFVIATANNRRQAKAVHDSIYEELKHGDPCYLPARVEGLAQCDWVLMDYLDVVVHIFLPDARDYYRLEKLWGDVPRLELKQAVPNLSSKR